MKENGHKPAETQKDPVTPAQDVQRAAKQDGQVAEEKPEKLAAVPPAAATKKGVAHLSCLHKSYTPW